MKKSSRQGIIRKLIQENEIETQEDLISFLQREGVSATQATVSRDIRELGIIKGHSNDGKVMYILNDQPEPPTQANLRSAVRESVVKISLVQFVVVIQTTLGSANVVAAVIDELQLPEVAGTLAGADTLVLFAKGPTEAQTCHDLIMDFMES